MTSTTETNKSKINFLQYLNTIILTIIGVFSIIIFLAVNNIRNNQQTQALDLMKLKTEQITLISKVNDIETRVRVLEINNTESIKNWIDANYIRKLQK